MVRRSTFSEDGVSSRTHPKYGPAFSRQLRAISTTWKETQQCPTIPHR
jgi:ribosomal protein L37AE/L43A